METMPGNGAKTSDYYNVKDIPNRFDKPGKIITGQSGFLWLNYNLTYLPPSEFFFDHGILSSRKRVFTFFYLLFFGL